MRRRRGIGDLQTTTDADVFQIFAKEQIVRDRNGKNQRKFRQSSKKLTGNAKGRNNFLGIQANAWILGENRKPLEEKQARVAKMEGLELKGDFEQRRSVQSNPENKAACFECGHTDHFKAQCPI